MRTIAVIARKGGSGKTTVAVHMAIAAHLRGRKTLLADADPQRSSSTVLKGRRSDGPSIMETAGPDLLSVQFAAQRRGFDLLA
ncbi:MAG: ParA family protein, partial [Caulobacteraceae bacterium]